MLPCWWYVQNHIKYQGMQCNSKTAPAEGSVWHTLTWSVTVCCVWVSKRASRKLNGLSWVCCYFSGLILVIYSWCACHLSHHLHLHFIKLIPSKFFVLSPITLRCQDSFASSLETWHPGCTYSVLHAAYWPFSISSQPGISRGMNAAGMLPLLSSTWLQLYSWFMSLEGSSGHVPFSMHKKNQFKIWSYLRRSPLWRPEATWGRGKFFFFFFFSSFEKNKAKVNKYIIYYVKQ